MYVLKAETDNPEFEVLPDKILNGMECASFVIIGFDADQKPEWSLYQGASDMMVATAIAHDPHLMVPALIADEIRKANEYEEKVKKLEAIHGFNEYLANMIGKDEEDEEDEEDD